MSSEQKLNKRRYSQLKWESERTSVGLSSNKDTSQL